MVNLYSAAYTKGESRDRDAKECDWKNEISMRRKGKSGNRRHWCIKASSGNLKYQADGGGHNPCLGFTPWIIGGGISVHDKVKDYPGKNTNYRGALVGLKCSGATLTDANLRSWSGNNQMLTAGVNDNRGGFKSLYEQAVFGVEVAQGRTDGYCSDIQNLNKVIHKDGGTCFSTIKNEVERKNQGILFCAKNPKDKKCACINTAKSGFVDFCKKNSNLPGCSEVVKGIKEFEKAGLQSATGLFGNADCIVPGICSGDVYQPVSPVPACANKNAICNQVMNLENVTAAADLKAVQGCNINFEAEQKKKDAPPPPPPPSDASPPPSKEEEEPSKTPTESGMPQSPGGVSRVQMGIGSLVSCCSIIILIIIIMMTRKK